MLPDAPLAGCLAAMTGSMLDVDHQARGAVIGQLDDAHAGFGREAEVPRALRLEIAALDRVDEGRKARREVGRAVVAARAVLHLLRAVAHDDSQKALALHD